MTMKLACLRCKRKKIKCDREEPICHQCITAKVECQYVERRKRPRLAQQKNIMQHLNQRLEELEKHVSGAGNDRSPSALLQTPRREAPRRSTPVPSPETSLTVADGQDSWIYRLATDTRRNFQNQATPVNTPTPSIDNAMSSLNEALEDLGRLRVRTEALNVEFDLSPAESRACIDRFADVMINMVIPDTFASTLIDVSLLKALPEVINSPYVEIDPGMRVMYYNALYYGLLQSEGPGGVGATKAYMKVLESVPAWLDSSSETRMDGHTAALTSWTCISMHDYQLSWKFHCKSCQYVKSKGIDQIDAMPARTCGEEDDRDALRYFYWHTLSVDVLFRLFYGKPRLLRLSGKVRPPLIFRANNMHPSAMNVTVSVVWVRYNTLTDNMVTYIENHASEGREDDLRKKTDECCKELEHIIAEWKLEQLMRSNETRDDHRCMLADHIMNVYANIIGIQRLAQTAVQRNSVQTVEPSSYSLRAARKVSNIILEFHTHPTLNFKAKSITNHFITFYPFCVVFTLYEHILACSCPDDCESDIQLLENLGLAMDQVCSQRGDMMPFAKTINALNRVSRTLQEVRQRETIPTQAVDAGLTVQGINMPPTSFDAIQNMVATELPDFDMSTVSVPEYPADVGSDFQSLGFFRALENDFVARNWQNDWWDLSGGVDADMGQMPGSA